MDKSRFVDALRRAVYDRTADSVLAAHENPPPRGMTPSKRALQAFLKGLSPDDRAHVRFLVEDGAHAALFGTLCVLDGARAIEDREPRGTLRLTYERESEIVHLNEDAGEDLHGLLGPHPLP